MTPEELAKSGSEHAHQRAYFAWLNKFNQTVWEYTFAIPNGGARAGDRQTAKIRGGMLKAEGVKSGVPDIFIAWPWAGYPGLFIEMKKMQGGNVSDKQTEFINRLRNRGYYVAICYNWQEAANATTTYFEQLPAFPHASNGA